MFYMVSISYNEGWNAAHALSAKLGRNIYVSRGVLFNNYPPLSFYLVTWLEGFGQDFIFTGRYISMASFFAVACCIFEILRTVTRSLWVSLFAALYFVSLFCFEYPQYVGINEPQMLGQFLSIASVLVFVKCGTSRLGLFGVAVLCLLAGLTKHNLIAFPIAATISIYLRQPERLRFWLLSCVLLLGATLLSLYYIFDTHIFASIFSPREFNPTQISLKATVWLKPAMILFGFLLVSSFLNLDFRFKQLLYSYLVVSALTAFTLSGGAGVYYNIYFDLLISSLLVAFAQIHCFQVAKDRFGEANPWARLALPCALCLPFLVAVPTRAYELVSLQARLALWEKATERSIAFITKTGGTGVCESMALCYWAGLPIVYDPFNATQISIVDKEFESEILKKLEKKEFAFVEVHSTEPNILRQRFSSRFRQKLREEYVIEQDGFHHRIYLPKSTSTSPHAKALNRIDK